MIVATRSDAADTCRCWRNSCTRPSPPNQWSLVVNQPKTWPEEVHQRARARDHGVAAPKRPSNPRSHDNRERDREDGSDNDRRAEEVPLLTVDDEPPEPTLTDQRRHGDEPDRRDRRDAHAGDDRRQRDRQLDMQSPIGSSCSPCRRRHPGSRRAPNRVRSPRSSKQQQRVEDQRDSAVVRDSPKMGIMSPNSATDGIVYQTARNGECRPVPAPPACTTIPTGTDDEPDPNRRETSADVLLSAS